MQARLVSFIEVLRNHELRISTAETLDALAVADLLGYRERTLLRDGLSLALAKSAAEKTVFRSCFDRFFQNPLAAGSVEAAPDSPAAPAEPLPQSPPSLDLEAEMAADPALRTQLDNPLLRMLQADDRGGLALAIAGAAQRAGLSGIQMFTQKGQYTRRILDELGEAQLRDAALALEQRHSIALPRLQGYRDRLRELVRDQVEREYLLQAQAGHGRIMDEVLLGARLNHIEHYYRHRVYELVRKMSRRLVARHSRRRRVYQRGQLHMAKTMRRGIAQDGVLSRLYWKSVKRDRPQILAVCDVSGSVAAHAKFLLMFLYSLQDVLPGVRSFAFSSHLGEVSDCFAQNPVEKAVELVNFQYGGATDYGNSLLDFARLALPDVSSRSTIIVLGDARNNHGDPRLEVMQSLYQRAGKVLWLNPESRRLWGSGDSEMLRYLPCCHYAAECGNLRQLERIVDQLLRHHG